MSKVKLFIENFLIYGLGGVIGKVIPFLMLPLITRLMPEAAYFGLNDLIIVVASFAGCFAKMGMRGAMFRMFFEKTEEHYRRTVCSTAFVFVCCMSAVVACGLILFREAIGQSAFGDARYIWCVWLSAAAATIAAVSNIVSAPTQMQNQRRIFLIWSAIAPILSYGIAIVLLCCGYYIIALPLAAIMSEALTGGSFFLMNRRWFSVWAFDRRMLCQLLPIGIPVMLSFLIYWIFNSCDKLMIAQFLDVGQVGIYAIGSKLGHASQLIHTAFAGGWQYFAFSTMREENQVESNSLVHEYLGAVSFLAGMWICGIVGPLFEWLFPPDYFSGYIVAPYLFLAPLLMMLYQVAGNQFMVIKRAAPSALILFFGALTNVALNYYLIPRFGIEGAAISTLIGYVVSDVVCIVVLCRMRLMVVSVRFFLIVGVTIVYFVVWRLWLYEAPLSSLALAAVASVVFVFLYKRELLMIAGRVRAYLDAKGKCA